MPRKHTFEAASDNSRQLARQLYEAYGTNSGNKTFDGRDMPTWAALTPEVKGHWIAVAETAVRDPAVAESAELARQNAQRERERQAATTTETKSPRQLADEQNATDGNQPNPLLPTPPTGTTHNG